MVTLCLIVIVYFYYLFYWSEQDNAAFVHERGIILKNIIQNLL